MKVSITVDVVRDDGTRLIREVRTDSGPVWHGRSGTYARENRAQLRQRVDRLLKSALNATLGGQ